MNLRRRFNLFCFRNRDKGIPNLMLYIALGNAVVLILSLINGGSALYELLYFDKAKILDGQVWRLFTYIFTQSGNDYISLIFIYFFYMLGRHVEENMGTLKFNLYYLCGLIIMDVFAMIFSPMYPTQLYISGGYYLHLSLVLAMATLHPDSGFMLLMIIPIKAWLLAVVYLVLVLVDVVNLPFPHCFFPLVALGNYFLFVGSDIKNLLPLSWRIKLSGKKPQKKTGTIPFSSPVTRQADTSKREEPYNHKCTVCGRTDTTNPELEFRYCSRCNGYHCYCEDHINNHEHIE